MFTSWQPCENASYLTIWAPTWLSKGHFQRPPRAQRTSWPPHGARQLESVVLHAAARPSQRLCRRTTCWR
jgi:hypothetical protein